VKDWKAGHNKRCGHRTKRTQTATINSRPRRVIHSQAGVRIPENAECNICLERDDNLIPLGCACRDNAGFGHVDCLVKAAEARMRTSDRNGWHTCTTCKQLFTGEMWMRLAESYMKHTESFNPESEDRLAACNNMGGALYSSGQFAEAAKIFRENLNLSKKVLGRKHPNTLEIKDNLGSALGSSGQHVEAAKMHRETLNLRKKVLGPEHPDTLNSMNNLGCALCSSGQYVEAAKMHRETLNLRKKVLGPKHPDTLSSMNNLGNALDSSGQYVEAAKMRRETLNVLKKVLGSEHPNTLDSMNNLGNALGNSGQHVEAAKMHRETLNLRKKVLGPEHPDTLSSMGNLGNALGNSGQYVEAAKIFRQTLIMSKKVLGHNHPDTVVHATHLKLALQKQEETSVHTSAYSEHSENRLVDGDRVMLTGLAATAHLNGMSGVIVKFVQAKDRYVVQVDTSKKTILVKMANLQQI